MCRDAYKRLDTVKVMQLLNGQRNLSGTDMRRLDLSDIDFRGSSMYRARVDAAILAHAMLSGKDTNLRHASFVEAQASNADFSESRLNDAKLGAATLTEASFEKAQAPNADFGKTNLDGAKLGGAGLVKMLHGFDDRGAWALCSVAFSPGPGKSSDPHRAPRPNP